MYRLMIVDDEPQIIEGIRRMLDWESYGVDRIVTATNGSEAIEKTMEFQPHIGIFDVCIGDQRGYELIEKLNTLEVPTKYIMISGYDEFEFARRAIHAGAKDYLMKPVDRNELRRAVEKVITEDFHGTIIAPVSEEEDIDPVLGMPYTTLSNLTCKVLLIVKAEYGGNLNLSVIAEKFKMNSNYLGHIFLKETRLKFSEYLMAYRMLQAKKLIESTDDKIYFIAKRVGYENSNYFYAHFRSFFNQSPTDLRRP